MPFCFSGLLSVIQYSTLSSFQVTYVALVVFFFNRVLYSMAMSYFVVYFLVGIQVSLTPGYCEYLLWTISHSVFFHVFVSIKVF